MRLGASDPLPGTVLSRRYRLERVLGDGASATVFAATDAQLDRVVAVKVMRSGVSVHDDDLRARFSVEGKTLARLSHPHIVAIHDVGQTDAGLAFLVMEFGAQGTLDTELNGRGRLAAPELISLILPVMGALACAHDSGIVHQDLKPANIVFTGASARERRAKVLDFGVARLPDIDTNWGRVGTPAYMAPEQIATGVVGPHTDVWAIGVILFQALSGRLPFACTSQGELLRTIVYERAPQLSSVCSEASPRLAVAIDRALEPAWGLRYHDMREFARALAIACRLDSADIPTAPDPIGLPQFCEWLEEADVQATAKLLPEIALKKDEPSPAAKAMWLARLDALRRRGPRMGWLVPLGSALVGAVAALFVLANAGEAHSREFERDIPPVAEERARTQEPTRQVQVVITASRPDQTGASSAALDGAGFGARGQISEVVSPLPIREVVQHIAPALSSRAEPRRPLRRRRAESILKDTTRADEDSAAPPEGSGALTPSHVITRWDW